MHDVFEYEFVYLRQFLAPKLGSSSPPLVLLVLESAHLLQKVRQQCQGLTADQLVAITQTRCQPRHVCVYQGRVLCIELIASESCIITCVIQIRGENAQKYEKRVI